MKRIFALCAVSWLLMASPASAIDAGKGTPGFCPDANGVTVVIDFQELGGTTIVRCAPGDQQTGHAALKNAGFGITGTNRWGEAFICRIEAKPSPNSESCKDTPPANAYWSYWYAPNGGAWKYSEWGVMNRKPPPGSFEGWSFAKDKTETTNPPPRIGPLRPEAPPAPPKQPAPPPPQGGGKSPAPPAGSKPSSQPATGQPSNPGRPSTPPASSEQAAPTTASSIPTSKGTTNNGVEWTGDPGLASNQQPTGVPWMVIVGGVVILALATGAAVTMRRRKNTES